ncbi:MAG: hypothetical protein NTW87_32170, partial [Planctomycetota bacterium]|nr:hypothetical protein [Planctomycetota bacterium]
LIAEIIPRTLAYDSQAKFVLLASEDDGDSGGKALEARFYDLARRYPGQVYFNNGFNPVFAKLIFAGGDFTLIPSRFEPCGLTDYEAAWLGTLPIARRTGGLAKIANCGYLYDWLDIRDWFGEADAFFGAIQAALGTYRNDPARHQQLMRTAMALNAGWEEPAAQYIHMYRYGFLAKQWRSHRNALVERFIKSLGSDRAIFNDFFTPGLAEYGDKYDWELKRKL